MKIASRPVAAVLFAAIVRATAAAADGSRGAGGAALPVARPGSTPTSATLDDRPAQPPVLAAVSVVERRRDEAALGAVAGRLARSTSPTWTSGTSRSARSSGRSSRSTAARSRRGSCGRRARTTGCSRPTPGTRRRPTPSWRRSPASPNIAEVGDGKRHSIPSVARVPLVPRLEPHRDARLQRAAAVDRSRSERAARRAADRRHADAAHAGRREPDHAGAAGAGHESAAHRAPSSPLTRTALGYLSTNCGSCHNRESSIASLGLDLKHRLADDEGSCVPAAIATTVGQRGPLGGSRSAGGIARDRIPATPSRARSSAASSRAARSRRCRRSARSSSTRRGLPC